MPALAAVSLVVDGTGHHFVYRCAAAEPSAFGNVLIRDMARVLRRDFANDIDALVTHVRERYSAPAAKQTAARRRTLSFRAIIDRAVPTKRVIADWQYVIDCDERHFYIMDRNSYLLEAVTRGLEFTLDDDRFADPDLLVPAHRATEPPPADETSVEPPRWIKTPEWQTVPVPPADEVRRMIGYKVPEATEVFAVAISDGHETTDHTFIPVTRYMTWDNIMTRARHALYEMPTFRHCVLERYTVRACLFSATPRLAHQGAGARVLDVTDPTPGAPFEALVPGAVLYASVVYLVDHGVWWTPFGRTGPYCAHCGSCAGPELRLKTCSVCRGPYYCSVDCQRAHWREGGHKSACIKKA